jgi:tRNA-specific 2-thiouridylase
MKTVVVGMSGGVDSSVSAWLLKEQGYRVIGLFMKNWEEADARGVCKASVEYEDASRICEQIQIPIYSVNFVEEYREQVFSEFLADLQKGLTPNPDILCNREIKFKVFLEKAKELGANFLATGHYCRLSTEHHLLKGKDPDKDQSYFLHAVKQKALTQTIFPVGHLHKTEVRAIARKQKLATSEKKESTGICFIGERKFKPFISKYLCYHSGDLQLLSGQIVGKHDGAAFYTIGQRKGLGLGGEGAPWYVVDKDITRNIVYVERGENHPALFSSALIASRATWITDTPIFPLRCTAKIRYRQVDQPCIVYAEENETLRAVFDTPQRAITPGQSIVFYLEEECLGGAVINTALS